MLSVVIVTYNARKAVHKCLLSLKKSLDIFEKKTGEKWETIVIDNASIEPVAREIAQKYPWVRLIKNDVNTGFAAANNQGMKMASGEWLLLLNPDAFVFPETLSEMHRFMKTRKEADMAGCQLVYPDGTIQQSWGFFPTLLWIVLFMSFIDNLPVIRKHADAIHVRDLSRYRHTQETDWVTGAFIWLKSQVFEKTGGLDEKYFMYGEEMEWMYRAKKAGFKIFYTPVTKCIHLKGASIQSLVKAFTSEVKGYLYWFDKHNAPWERMVLPWILMAGGGFKALAWSIAGRREMAEANAAITKEILRTVFRK